VPIGIQPSPEAENSIDTATFSKLMLQYLKKDIPGASNGTGYTWTNERYSEPSQVLFTVSIEPGHALLIAQLVAYCGENTYGTDHFQFVYGKSDKEMKAWTQEIKDDYKDTLGDLADTESKDTGFSIYYTAGSSLFLVLGLKYQMAPNHLSFFGS
jgi:hypothetical protein